MMNPRGRLIKHQLQAMSLAVTFDFCFVSSSTEDASFTSLPLRLLSPTPTPSTTMVHYPIAFTLFAKVASASVANFVFGEEESPRRRMNEFLVRRLRTRISVKS